MIKIGFFLESNPIAVESVRANYWQDSDTNGHDSQSLELSTEEGGGGFYFVLKTERWAFDNIEEFVSVLKDFQGRLSNDGIKREILANAQENKRFESGTDKDGFIYLSQLEEILNELN